MRIHYHFILIFVFLGACARGGSMEANPDWNNLAAQVVAEYDSWQTKTIPQNAGSDDMINWTKKENKENEIIEEYKYKQYVFLCFRVSPDQRPGQIKNLLNAIIINTAKHSYRVFCMAKS